MLTKNDIDRIAGVLLVLLVVAFVVSIVTQVDVRFDRPDVREDLQGLIDDEALYATKTAFRLAGSLLLVVTGGALYLVFGSMTPRWHSLCFSGFWRPAQPVLCPP